MKKFLLLFSLSFFCFHFSFSQAPLVKQWDKTFGGTGNDFQLELKQVRDGGFILGGYSSSGIGGDKTESLHGYTDYWVVKTDALGNKQWDKRFGGIAEDFLYSIVETADSGYLLGGYSNSSIGGDVTAPAKGGFDYWIVKIDASGNKLWDKRFGSTANDMLYSISPTKDKGFVLLGESWSGIGGDKSEPSFGSNDYWLIKVDSLFNKQWDKTFGGTSIEIPHPAVLQTTDMGYILCGLSNSGIGGNKTQDTWGSNDVWIVKTDSLGNIQWDKTFGGTGSEGAYSVIQTPDGGFAIAVNSESPANGTKTVVNRGGSDVWIIKIDSKGNEEWQNRYGTTNNEYAIDMLATTDQGYLITTCSWIGASGDKTEPNIGQYAYQLWTMKIDSAGNKKWDKTIYTNESNPDRLHAIAVKDGFVFSFDRSANIGGYKSENGRGMRDYWIIKFKDTTACIAQSGIITALHDTVCPGAAPVLSVTGSSGTLQWQYSVTGNNFKDLVGLTGSLCLDIPLQTSYYRAYSGGNCADTSAVYKIIVLDAPHAAYSFLVSGSTVTFNSGASSGSIANYSWDFGDGTYSTLPNPVHTYNRADTFYACLTIYNGINCPSLICHDVIIAGIPTVTNNLSSKNELAIYPNPANNSLTINRNSYERHGTIRIYNQLGQLVYKKEINSEQIISTADFLSGNYYITLQTDESVEVKKFIVNH